MKKTQGLIIFLIVILIIILVMPLTDGLFVRHQYRELINAMNLKMNINGGGLIVKEEAYHLGWFRSDAKLRINFTDKDLASSFPTGIEVTDQIYHGPIAYDMSRHRYTFAMATIQSKIFLPANIHTKFFAVNNPNDPGIVIFSRMYFGGTLSQIIKISPINLENTGSLIIQDSKLISHFKLSNNQLKFLSQKGKIGAINFKNLANDIVTIASITFTQSLNLKNNDFYNTQNDFYVPEITYLDHMNTSVTLKNLKIHAERGINVKNLYDVQMKVTLDSLQTTFSILPSVTSFNYSFMINNLDPAGIKQYWSYFQTHQKTAFTAEDTKNLSNLLPFIFTPLSEFLLNVGFNSSMGNFNLNTNVTFIPGAQKVSSIYQLIPELQLAATLKLSQQMLREIVTNLINKEMAAKNQTTAVNQTAVVSPTPNLAGPGISTQSPPLNQPLPAQQTSNEKADGYIKKWEDAGYLVKDDGSYLIKFMMNAQGVMLNGKPFDMKEAFKPQMGVAPVNTNTQNAPAMMPLNQPTPPAITPTQ